MSNKTHEPREELDLFSVADLSELAASKAGNPNVEPPGTKLSESIKRATVNPSCSKEALNERYLRDSEVAQRYGVCRQTVWRWAALKKLPEPVKLSEGVTRWRLSDLVAHEVTLHNEKMAALRRHDQKKVRKSGERR